MKHKFPLTILFALLVVFFVTLAVSAQELPFSLYQVEPPEGYPGDNLDLILHGDGFDIVKITGVDIEDIEIGDFWIDSNEVIIVQAFIPESAPPGPRMVTVNASLGQNEPVSAYLEAGFFVLEREQEPPTSVPPIDEPTITPTPVVPPPPPFSWWWLIVPLCCLGILGAGIIAIALTFRRASLKRTWQQHATSGELPDTCQPDTHINRRESFDIKPGRWKVTALNVTLYDAAANKRGKAQSVSGELVSKIDKAARQRLLGEEEVKPRATIAGLAKELSAQILAWQSDSGQGKDAHLEAHLEGGEAEAKFARYKCVGQPGAWKKVLEWTAKLQAVDHLPASLRAPKEAESQGAYQAYLEEQLDKYLSTVITKAARLL